MMQKKKSFNDTFFELLAEYEKGSQLSEVIEQKQLGAISKTYMVRLFEMIDKKIISPSELKNQNVSMESARQIIKSHNEQEKIKELIMEQKEERKLEVGRLKEQPHMISISGEDTYKIKGFIKNKLDGVWNEKSNEWLVDGREQNVRKLYGQLANKVIEHDVMDQSKKEYQKNPNESTLLKYGSAILIYNEYTNTQLLQDKIKKIQDNLQKDYPSEDNRAIDIGLHNHLSASLVASKVLTELGFTKENDKNFVNFKSFEAKKALAENLQNLGDTKLMTQIADKAQEKAEIARKEYKENQASNVPAQEQTPETANTKVRKQK
ncbi:MAG: hypothetical protein M0R46_09935 [Candidatus Muirbacterium halophilum]|nr:hypothetical protein [Candidatus Muirbacterium halophilum]